MIKSDGFQASEYEFLEATTGRKEGYYNNKLYAISLGGRGQPGIWRRVPDPKTSDLATLGIVPAWFGGGVIYLKYDLSAAGELIEGGFVVNCTASEAIEQAIVRSAELHYNKSADGQAEIKIAPETRVADHSDAINEAAKDSGGVMPISQATHTAPTTPSLLETFKQQQAELDEKRRLASQVAEPNPPHTATVKSAGIIRPRGVVETVLEQVAPGSPQTDDPKPTSPLTPPGDSQPQG